ncbi:MAG: hypothetical protein KDD36_10070 [Flavobacteriales bacterium]|nr:hypothetical protein [Flavobacteriales bacterium]
MKTLSIIGTLLAVFSAPSVNEARLISAYKEAEKNMQGTEELIRLATSGETTALKVAFRASGEAFKAKHSWNPYTKLKYLARSSDSFGEAVKMDSGDIRIRFLRYAVEFNTPEFTGYREHLQKDHDMIVKGLADEATRSSIHPEFLKMMNELIPVSP